MLVSLLVNTLSVLLTAYLVPGVKVTGVLTAVLVAILLSIFNTVAKPILAILTLPVTILTLGLFIFVIDAFLVLVVSSLVPAFSVDGFIPALIFSLVMGIINSVLHSLVK